MWTRPSGGTAIASAGGTGTADPCHGPERKGREETLIWGQLAYTGAHMCGGSKDSHNKDKATRTHTEAPSLCCSSSTLTTRAHPYSPDSRLSALRSPLARPLLEALPAHATHLPALTLSLCFSMSPIWPSICLGFWLLSRSMKVSHTFSVTQVGW